ncbi:MAG: hypothetical protein EPO45_02725 [Sphingobium sp.]|jgi:hypothetical protein|uniref:Uncharacterized protein n=1 Tax=Sphingobium xenophagum TaxID=121428 RepID=A0A249MVH5_SPHXE|nr:MULTISPECIES: hypothetical protein [Sphingobium]MBU0659478.1 hypothetical protein [Alphaproteobacteria bacterium]ASY45195.1 hypothetical protein CJD35_12680 [Sphingobium xenophagum]MBA4755792.1 hypothetical protein [Sphingobium sp.]MBG6116651.1 hypothetical protein [Sphingobium sp. JAI105]MBS90755.1 hypothetical protein [Sphingobium sp.]|tara:strand:+ start:2507 stop:2728 length:222 start_codon:yes stop_codon:yes gene_type:complete
MGRIKRLFTIKTKFEAFLIIYALALGASERGLVYMQQYPGLGGQLLALACTGAVFMAGGKMIDALDYQRAYGS